MTTKHTPGPWYQDRNSYVASEIGTIARVYAGGRAATTREGRLAEAANAALIAAAPELLEALRDCVEAFQMRSFGGDEGQVRACINARAAIAKAEGRE